MATSKVDYNHIHDYDIEISRTQAKQTPIEYVRRQTLENVERCVIPELKNFEDKAQSSYTPTLAQEKELYEQLLWIIIEKLIPLQQCATASFVACADTPNYQALQFSDEPIHIAASRHPIVGAVMTNPYIPNYYTQLGYKRPILIITGPN